MEGILAGLNVVNLVAGFALGIVFGGKVRAWVAAGLRVVADFVSK